MEKINQIKNKIKSLELIIKDYDELKETKSKEMSLAAIEVFSRELNELVKEFK